MNLEKIKEELNIRGVSYIGQILTSNEIHEYVSDLQQIKSADIAEFGIEELKRNNSLETVSDLGRFGGIYYRLLENLQINDLINNVLNEKAVIHSYNAIILDKAEKSGMVGHGFHRDMPWFPNCRTSVIIMIPLQDYGSFNGSTQYVPGTHVFKDMPSLDFMEKYVESTKGAAGEGFIVDSTTWHRAGNNQSGKPRPMIVLKYTLAPFKQQIEFYLSNPKLKNASDLVKQRLGWDVRVPHNYIENRDWNQKTRKFKSGQYDMKNTYFR